MNVQTRIVRRMNDLGPIRRGRLRQPRALAASLAAGQDIEGAARRAVAAATISTRRAGAREGMPTADELAAFLES